MKTAFIKEKSERVLKHLTFNKIKQFGIRECYIYVDPITRMEKTSYFNGSCKLKNSIALSCKMSVFISIFAGDCFEKTTNLKKNSLSFYFVSFRNRYFITWMLNQIFM